MLRWANRRSFFRCGHAGASAIEERRLWLDACVQIFVSPFASKASSHDAAIIASKVSKSKSISIHGDAKSKVSTQHAHAHFSAGGDATISVCNAGRQNIRALACSHHDSKAHSVNGDAKVFEPATCMPYANKAQNASSDLQQKVGLLELEQFSLSDVAKLVKKRAFKSCSFEQLSTVLQVLKETFPSAKIVHNIVVGSSNILLQPAELVQQKLKLLYDFQVEEKVVSKLCGRGKVLSNSVESLQKKLMFYKDTGLTVDARNMMFSKGPLLLSFSIENHIKPTLNFLESTGFTRESNWYSGQCCDVFYVSLDNNLVKKYEYFRQLGFSTKEFSSACRALGRSSIKSIEERMQSLKHLGFTDDDVLLMVKKQVAILCCSPEYTKRKVDFLICEQNRDMAEIVHLPCCLTYSLQGRMVPRFNIIKGFGDSKVYPLSSILCVSDSRFIKRFGK